MTPWEWMIEDTKNKMAETLDALRRELLWAIDEAKCEVERRREIEADCASLREQLAEAQRDAERYQRDAERYQWIISAEPGASSF